MQPRTCERAGLMAVLAATALACKSDPTADQAGTPTAIRSALSSVNVALGKTTTFTAWVADANSARLAVSVSFAACDATIATVAADPAYQPVPATSSQAVVGGVFPGTTCAVVTSSGLKPDTVTVKVPKTTPTLTTLVTPLKGAPGVTLNDKATLGGGFGTLTGTITFTLFDPTQVKDTCKGTPRYAQTLTVSGAGAFTTSPGFVTDTGGTWGWRAAYSGDTYNSSVTTSCTAEPVLVKATPTFSTLATPTSGTLGVTLNDQATLGGGFGTLSGTITFALFDPSPSGASCTGTPRYTETVKVSGAGTFTTSPGFATDKAGTWRWTAAYSGDTNNNIVTTDCNDEPVVIS